MPINPDRYEFGSTDAQTFSTDPAGDGVQQYDAVKLTGEMEVGPTDTVAEDAYGVAVTGADAGEDVGVYIMGAHPTHVTNPDGTVGFGDYLTPSGTAGVLRPINTGGATGETRQEDGLFLALTGESDDGRATVHIR